MKRLIRSQNARRTELVMLAIADSVFFTRTDPSELPSLVLIAAFVLVGLTVFVAVFYLLKLPKWYGIELGKHSVRVSLIVSGAVCALLAMRSVGQLGSKDIVVLVPLAVLSYFYLQYARRAKRATISPA